MDALFHQIAQRPVHGALPLDTVHFFELGRNDFDCEVAFAAAIIPGMAMMLSAIVDDPQMGWVECRSDTFFYFGLNRPFRILVHGSYIGGLHERSTLGLESTT